MNPALSMAAKPSDVNPSPLMCEWDEIRGDFPAEGQTEVGQRCGQPVPMSTVSRSWLCKRGAILGTSSSTYRGNSVTV